MFQIRKSNERGYFNHGWLQSYHSFSFGDYYDPNHLGFRNLRVINQDIVAPGQGFGTHPHKDMEIITYITLGVIEHKDSLGTSSQISKGEIQVMSAGTGIRHSEFNPSKTDPLHLLQIWILPDKSGHAPRYDQKEILRTQEKAMTLVASPDGRNESLLIHQDVFLYSGQLESKQNIEIDIAKDRGGWIQVISGEIQVNQIKLSAGDGLAFEQETQLKIHGLSQSEFLFFDLN